MKPELARVDRWEEVASDEREQEERRDRERQECRQRDGAVLERPVERALIGAGQPAKARLETV